MENLPRNGKKQPFLARLASARKRRQGHKAVEVANEVNLWAEKQTNGLIKQILPATATAAIEDRNLIFANAVYFKGEWSQKFHRSTTKESDFHLLDGNKVQVPFMTNMEQQLVKEYDDFKVLGLPYKHGQDKRQFTMYIFLPNAKDGLQSLVRRVGSSSDFLDRHIPYQIVDVAKFFIPTFKISFGFEAAKMLKELGAVSRDVDDFTEIVELCYDNSLYVSTIHHKSFVEVNEDGTIAVAASALVADSIREVNFVADHPFLFVIREDVSGTLLFMGHVINPHVGLEGS
ncbi:hypothetical protein QVD17_39142 [Tagetes erecta]|uniref:Serpin domain-containing protein n=1 Tax=Tagetes erecta TaxID=13708 RepID=A0AAD8JPQ0_TARER|nr:hypothetical protein QVD17_39142 [Tagetes erecta]